MKNSENFSSPSSSKKPDIEERWLKVDLGRIRYLATGEGPPLVLVHGLLGYAFSWRFTLPALASSHTVYALDMLGSGFSDKPADIDYSLRGNASRLLMFMDELGITSSDLLGSSHGGAVVMRTAALAPHRVRRMVLAAPVNPWAGRGRWLAPALSNRVVRPLFERAAPHLGIAHSVLLRRLFGDTRRIAPGTLAGYTAPFSSPGIHARALSVLRNWNADLADLASSLPLVRKIPTLLLWGSEDRAVNPASAPQLRTQFENCRLLVFDGIGHLPYEEVPTEFNRAVSDFLTARA